METCRDDPRLNENDCMSTGDVGQLLTRTLAHRTLAEEANGQ